MRAVTDAVGSLKAGYSYDPYGRRTVLSGSAADSDFGYTGHFSHQASGLALAPYRAYDADIGRWISRDPIGLSDGSNLYGYVENNPVNLVDPLGLVGEIPNPNGTVPGGPWTPAGSGQRSGDFWGPKPSSGPRPMCRYVPDQANGGPSGAASPYWKTQLPGVKGWNRYDLNGNPVTPEQAHPASPSVPLIEPPAIPAWIRIGVGVGGMIYSKPAY